MIRLFLFLTVIMISCGKRNMTSDFFIDIPLPAYFEPREIQWDKDFKILYDQKDGNTDILLIKTQKYNTSSLFSKENTTAILSEFGQILKILSLASQMDDVKDLISEKDFLFIKSLPSLQINVFDADSIKRQIMNIDENYALKINGTYTIGTSNKVYPTVMYAIHNKFRHKITYIQYLKLKNNRGENLDKYTEMMTAVESANLF